MIELLCRVDLPLKTFFKKNFIIKIFNNKKIIYKKFHKNNFTTNILQGSLAARKRPQEKLVFTSELQDIVYEK